MLHRKLNNEEILQNIELHLMHAYSKNEELMLLNCGVGEDSWESLGLGDAISQS